MFIVKGMLICSIMKMYYVPKINLGEAANSAVNQSVGGGRVKELFSNVRRRH